MQSPLASLVASLVLVFAISCGSPAPVTTPSAASSPSSAGPSSSDTTAPVAAAATPAPSGRPSVQPSAAPPAIDVEPYKPPEGFVVVPGIFDEPEGASKSVMCGKLRVENLRGDPNVFEPYVVVTDTVTNKKIYEAHGRRYDVGEPKVFHMSLTAGLCGDLTGDGIPELMLTERTEGAHCCYTYYVASLTKPSKLIMTWDKGDSGNGFWPVKLKPGKTWQIESIDLVWPPFKVEEGDPSVSYAGVPGFPIVFDLVGGTYQKKTFAFIDALKKERDERVASCIKRRGTRTDYPDGCEPYELSEWGDAVMFDEWDAQKEKVIPDAELRKQLDKRAKEMKQRLRAQLGG